MFSKLKDKAKKLAEDKHIADVKDKGGEILEQQIPRVRVLLKERIGSKAKDAIQSDEFMIEVFTEIYDLLTEDHRAIRLIIKRDRFIGFCMKNRDRLIDQADPKGLIAAPEQPVGNDIT